MNAIEPAHAPRPGKSLDDQYLTLVAAATLAARGEATEVLVARRLGTTAAARRAARIQGVQAFTRRWRGYLFVRYLAPMADQVELQAARQWGLALV